MMSSGACTRAMSAIGELAAYCSGFSAGVPPNIAEQYPRSVSEESS
jgi:hypothetical protein